MGTQIIEIILMPDGVDMRAKRDILGNLLKKHPDKLTSHEMVLLLGLGFNPSVFNSLKFDT